MFYFLEEYLERRLFCIMCELHTNELKLRKLISKREGKTSSKDKWEQELVKLLPTVSALERTLTFPAIPGETSPPDLPEDVVKDLSSNQHYTYRNIKAVRYGEMDKNLPALVDGKTNGSEQLTCSVTGGATSTGCRVNSSPS